MAIGTVELTFVPPELVTTTTTTRITRANAPSPTHGQGPRPRGFEGGADHVDGTVDAGGTDRVAASGGRGDPGTDQPEGSGFLGDGFVGDPGTFQALTVATKAAYQHAVAERRCIVAVDAFYEWRISKWKVGQTVPVKISLADVNGVRISDTEAAGLASACQVKFSASGAQTTTPQCMKYDASSHQFVFTWKPAKTGTGTATISVAISYGTSTTTAKSETISFTK